MKTSVADQEIAGLEAEITSQAAHLDTALCRWLRLVEGTRTLGTRLDGGVLELAVFLNWRCS